MCMCVGGRGVMEKLITHIYINFRAEVIAFLLPANGVGQGHDLIDVQLEQGEIGEVT